MRNIIRRWLGIIDHPKPSPISQEELRRMITQAMSDALRGKSDTDWGVPLSMYNLPNALQSALKEAARDTAIECAKAVVNSNVGTEEFIDNVVARIKRKQVG